MNIGPYALANKLFVAPMAGVTDRPFRQLCKQLGAGYAVSEMVTSRRDLWDSLKTSRRANHEGEAAPIAVQIAGTDAQMMAEAAAYNVDRGAQIIDINMGCPAKKVCNKWAGSALMQDETLALQIVAAVVAACAPHNVPVTLKMRTGWAQDHKNALTIARAAESAGVQMVTVHGRTREQGYKGFAEYDTIAAVKAALRIPVVANGEIWTVEDARRCRQASGCDMLMLGRGVVTDPGLGLAIKASMNGSAAEPTAGRIWPELVPLLADFWQVVCTRLEARARAGRLKQWLNFLRRRFPEAETAYQQLRTINDPVLVHPIFLSWPLSISRKVRLGAGLSQI
ncbi:MAG: tRNA dihydrouridine synthase DusB [Lysobacterales bacterium]